MYDKMAISAYILKIVKKDPFLRLQMRAKEMFDYFQNISRNGHFVTHLDPPPKKKLRRKCLIVTNFFPQISNT